MNLKQLLTQHDVNQNAIAKQMNVSAPLINLFVNHGQRPKKNPEQFQSKFIEILQAKGIAADQIQQAIDAANAIAANDQAASNDKADDWSIKYETFIRPGEFRSDKKTPIEWVSFKYPEPEQVVIV